MHYEPLNKRPVHRILPDVHEVFRSEAPGLEYSWEADATGDEILFCEGRPVARVLCRERRWVWSIIGSPRPPLRAGSRAEARQLAIFFANRTCG